MAVKANEFERRLRAYLDACASHGLKMTPQRAQIFREVARGDGHPDAETVLRRVRAQMPNVSLDTVYRTLCLFERMGLIARVEILCDRARFDANTAAHHHFVCVECGAIRDLVRPVWDQCPAADDLQAIGTVHSMHVQLRGLCAKCAVQERDGGGRSRGTSVWKRKEAKP